MNCRRNDTLWNLGHVSYYFVVGGGKDREEMRLIDADALCKKIREIYNGYMLDEGCTPIEFERMVDDMPTAFDTEKVVEQLESARNCHYSNKWDEEGDLVLIKSIESNIAIDIVKKGGVE